MVYLGRLNGFFTTKEGKVGAVYAISGRSDFSRAREFNVLEEAVRTDRRPLPGSKNYFPSRSHSRKILTVDPINGEMTKEQEIWAPYIFYTAIITEEKNRVTGKPSLFISNGVQTEAIARAHDFVPEEVRNRGKYLERTLATYEHETDHPIDTARIGGFYTKRGEKNEEGKLIFIEDQFGLGIITNTPQLMSLIYTAATGSVIGTYDREESISEKKILIPPKSEKGELSDIIHTFQPSGESADEICNEFFQWLDKAYTASAAVFLLNNGKWEHAVNNFEKTKRSA